MQQKQVTLSAEILTHIDEWVRKFPSDRKQSALIAALHIAQESNGGWLSEDLINGVADYLEIPRIAAYEVATFYSMFELKPIGQHKISVCTNISCQLSGSEEIACHLKKRLGIEFGETTADGHITLKEVECLGACVNAPVMQLDKDYHEHLTPERIDEILASIK